MKMMLILLLKALKRGLNEELMPTAWHPNRWSDFWVSEVAKKEIDPIFLKSCKSFCR